MLLDAAVLAITVGMIAGGRLGRLKELDLRAPWVFVLAAAAQVGLMVLGAAGVSLGVGWAPALYVLTFVLVLMGIWANRRLPGMCLVGAGVFLNLVVIAANGGSMPVDRGLAVRAGNTQMVEMLDSPAYTNHVAAGEGTRLRWLGDVLALPMVVPRPEFYSPGSVGDVLVTLGACWLLLYGLGAFGLGAARGPVGNDDAAGTSGTMGTNGTGNGT